HPVYNRHIVDVCDIEHHQVVHMVGIKVVVHDGHFLRARHLYEFYLLRVVAIADVDDVDAPAYLYLVQHVVFYINLTAFYYWLYIGSFYGICLMLRGVHRRVTFDLRRRRAGVCTWGHIVTKGV